MGILAFSASAQAAPVNLSNPEPVIAAERAFAVDGAALGIQAAFLKWMAPAAIIFAPGPVSARDFYAAQPDRTGLTLSWWPVWAGSARSGDLGFTTGPFTLNGHPAGYYFTIWVRQRDGAWRWAYDGGTDSNAQAAPSRSVAPVVLAAATGRGRYQEHAEAEVRAAEERLAAKSNLGLAAAYQAVLAPDARVQGSPAAPAATPQAIIAELASRAPAIAFTTLGAHASHAGDLAWTYGQAAWSRDGAKRTGHYVRFWRHDRAGWRLVFDQILNDPPPKA